MAKPRRRVRVTKSRTRRGVFEREKKAKFGAGVSRIRNKIQAATPETKREVLLLFTSFVHSYFPEEIVSEATQLLREMDIKEFRKDGLELFNKLAKEAKKKRKEF